MSRAPRFPKSHPAALGLGLSLSLALTMPAVATAQQTDPGQTNISTGSGAGTSAGVSPGSSPSSTRVGIDSLSTPPGGFLEGPMPGPNVPYPPNASGVRMPAGLPDDPSSAPFIGIPAEPLGVSGRTPLDPKLAAEVDALLLPQARAIVDPADRALALDRAARAFILSNNFDDAQTAIIEGGQSAILVQDRVVRDIRLMALVTTSIALAEETIREGTVDDSYRILTDTRPPRSQEDRIAFVNAARRAMAHAYDLASKIESENFRSETLYRAADNQSINSQTIARYAIDTAEYRSPQLKEANPFRQLADAMLTTAERNAMTIDFPVWRDQALLRIVASAATSAQYDRGLQIALRIPQPEIRSDALIRLAESQARDTDPSQAEGATRTYQEAVRAVASISLEDPRIVLGNVLIDSLISVGRFEDARAVSRLIPDRQRQLRALGAVAESQGERGLAKEAFAWISSEVPPGDRDLLRLRVNEGTVRWLQNFRTAPQSMQGLRESLPSSSGSP